MKKSAALASTSIVGLGLATLAAVPAHAADVTTPCTSVDDHFPSDTAASDNWYMDCVPQYGLGKVEFTVDSEVDFPAGFAGLDDPGVTSTSVNTGPEATEYFDSTSPIAGFTHLEEVDSTSTTRDYEGTMMFAISGVTAIDVSALPDDCGQGPYAKAYRVDYLPATVTFTQTIDGDTWTVVVTYTPSPLYLGLNFEDPFDFDGDAVQCASSDTGTAIGDPSFPPSMLVVLGVHASAYYDNDAWIGSLSPFPAIEGTPVGQLGTFAATVPSPDPDPELAATGIESAGVGLAGALSILAGVMLTFFWRRRRGDERA